MRSRIGQFACLFFAAYVMVATSVPTYSVKQGNYAITSDCPGGKIEGTEEFGPATIYIDPSQSDQPTEQSGEPDLKQYGFPTNRSGFRFTRTQLSSSDAERTCIGNLILDAGTADKILFICKDPVDTIVCTIFMERI